MKFILQMVKVWFSPKEVAVPDPKQRRRFFKTLLIGSSVPLLVLNQPLFARGPVDDPACGSTGPCGAGDYWPDLLCGEMTFADECCGKVQGNSDLDCGNDNGGFYHSDRDCGKEAGGGGYVNQDDDCSKNSKGGISYADDACNKASPEGTYEDENCCSSSDESDGNGCGYANVDGRPMLDSVKPEKGDLW